VGLLLCEILSVANIQLLVFLARFLAPNHHLFGCEPLRLASEISYFKYQTHFWLPWPHWVPPRPRGAVPRTSESGLNLGLRAQPETDGPHFFSVAQVFRPGNPGLTDLIPSSVAQVFRSWEVGSHGPHSFSVAQVFRPGNPGHTDLIPFL
jgi:hypothetical protein